ncbi:MAG: hypothetical protein GWO20_16350 [Candidatus Korarchaeota archaeon]|nr:hypothetical protein [Candidatus Korarchaeota archaeon]NIU84983.1 hypothetical protein [Candidatus Thorarchaeota archaeon]NIW15005.1 hypothetical protein [Candidatus Thorarchaeota archaeon]NIW53015.1 hypothetical protein [Candidatus Korarchaeota archaeon]
MKVAQQERFEKLRWFNAVMCLIHLIQGLLLLFLSNDKTWPITTTYLKFNPISQKLEPASNVVANLQLGPLVALFLFISALAHFLISTVLYKRYVEHLQKHMNPYRWYEYSVSASVMIVVIAMLTGIYDLGTLVACFILTGVMNLMGLMMEVHNQTTEETTWTSYVIGCIAGIGPWIVIGISLGTAEAASGGSVPDFVIAIFVSIAVFFNLFAINMLLQYKKVWKWENYLYGERMYVILSLVAKSALAWQVFAGTLAPI